MDPYPDFPRRTILWRYFHDSRSTSFELKDVGGLAKHLFIGSQSILALGLWKH